MPKRKSNTEELTDRLIYKNKTIKTNDILMIFFGCSQEDLEKAERWTPESREEERLKVEKAVAKAKKAMGIHLVSHPACWRPPVVSPPAKPKRKKRTGKELKELKKNEQLVAVGTAFRKFKHWVGIAFHGDTSGGYIANDYPTKKFVQWVVENNILKELKKLDIATTDRARHFVGLFEDQQAEPTKKPKTKSKRHAQSQADKKAVRKIAKKLWKEDKSMTIRDVIMSNDINRVALNYHERTLQGWVKDLCPNNKPGRRPKKN